jgi:hypothetical protein
VQYYEELPDERGELIDQHRPFIQIDKAVIKDFLPKAGMSAFCVYAGLLYYANRESKRCWPGIGRLAKLLGISKPTVRSALLELKQGGLISIKERTDCEQAGFKSMLYTILALPQIPSQNSLPGVVKKLSEASIISLPGVVKKLDPNKINRNKIKEQQKEAASQPPQKEFSDAAITLFREFYRTDPTWPKAAYMQLATLIKSRPGITVKEFCERYRNMLTTGDDFHRKQVGSLIYFVTHYDQFMFPVRRKTNGRENQGDLAANLAANAQEAWRQLSEDNPGLVDNPGAGGRRSGRS